MAMPGPPELGRGVVVLSGMALPKPWQKCPKLLVEQQTLADPVPALEELQRSWFERQPLVVELAVDPQVLRDPEVWHQPVYDLARGSSSRGSACNSSSGRTTMTPAAASQSGGTHGRRPGALLIAA